MMKSKDTGPCQNPDCDGTYKLYRTTDPKFCSPECLIKCKPPAQKKPYTPAEKKQYKIARRSKKRAKEEIVYNQLVKVWLIGKICPITKKPATEVHHKKGRIGKLLLDTRFWLGVTRKGHKWIEEHPEEAKKLGYSLSRLEKDGEEG
jgi:hypothetical protein